MALWIHSPTSTGVLQECRQASFKAHKNANKLRIFCQEPSCRRLVNFVRPWASIPRTTKDKPAYCCTPIIDGKKNFKDPQVPLAAELVSWPWRLQEQAHGASAQAPSWCGAQSGRRQRPRQLDNIELDSSSNKAEAACQGKASSKPTCVPMLGMPLPRLPFS